MPTSICAIDSSTTPEKHHANLASTLPRLPCNSACGEAKTRRKMEHDMGEAWEGQGGVSIRAPLQAYPDTPLTSDITRRFSRKGTFPYGTINTLLLHHCHRGQSHYAFTPFRTPLLVLSGGPSLPHRVCTTALLEGECWQPYLLLWLGHGHAALWSGHCGF